MLARLRSGALLVALIGMPVLAQEPDPLRTLPEVASPAGAPVTAPVARAVKPDRIGYAFSDPAILLRQRLIGLAHGLRLLGRTCLLNAEFSLAAEQAYAAWFARQQAAIEAMSLDLEHWYFGNTVPELDPAARLREVIRLLGLRTELRAMDPAEQRAACTTYAQAIAGPRYDFVALLDDAARELVGQAGVSPAVGEATPVTMPESSADDAEAVAPDVVAPDAAEVTEPTDAPEISKGPEVIKADDSLEPAVTTTEPDNDTAGASDSAIPPKLPFPVEATHE